MMKILVLLIVVSVSAFANEGLPKVFLDCYLPSNYPANCDILRVDYVSTESYEVIENKEEADVIVFLTQINDGNFTKLITHFKDLKLQVDFFIEERYINTLTNNEAYNRTFDTLLQDTSFFVGIEKVEGQPNEVRIVRNVKQGVPDDSKNQNFWVEPNARGNVSSGLGNSNMNLSGGAWGTYAVPKWKIQVGGNYRYNTNKVQQNLFQPGLESNNRTARVGFNASHTIKGSFSAALLGDFRQNQSNFAFADPELNDTLDPLAKSNRATYKTIGAGAEWVKYPFQESDQGNIAIQYTVGPQFHNYVDPDTITQTQEMLFVNSLRFVLSKHFDKFDPSVSLTALTDFGERGYKELNLNANTDYRITNRITFNANFSVGYSENWVPNSATAGSFATLTSGNRDALFITGGLGIRFIIGNPSVPNKDNRWD